MISQLPRPGLLGVAATEISADTISPVTAALRLHAQDRLAFILESVEGGARYGRYSMVGVRGRILSLEGDEAIVRAHDYHELERFSAWKGNRDTAATPFGSVTGTPAYYDVRGPDATVLSGSTTDTCTRTCDTLASGATGPVGDGVDAINAARQYYRPNGSGQYCGGGTLSGNCASLGGTVPDPEAKREPPVREAVHGRGLLRQQAGAARRSEDDGRQEPNPARHGRDGAEGRHHLVVRVGDPVDEAEAAEPVGISVPGPVEEQVSRDTLDRRRHADADLHHGTLPRTIS